MEKIMKRIMNTTLLIAVILAVGFMLTDSASAQQKGTGKGKVNGHGLYFVDENGDGICDNYGTHVGQKNGSGTGVCDGTGPKGGGVCKGTGVCDGTGPKGNGKGLGNGTGVCDGTGSGTGVCDGTGPKGKVTRGGRK